MSLKRTLSLLVLSVLPVVTLAADKQFVRDKAKGWFWHEQQAVPLLPELPGCLANGAGAIFWDAAGVTHSALRIDQTSVVSRDQFGVLNRLPYEAVNCEPPKPEKPKPEPKEQPEESPPETEPAAPAAPAPLSTEWFEKNLDDYRSKAIDNPSDPNAMRAYLYLQRVAMDKAEIFSKTYQQVVMGDPFLDETNRLAVAGFASMRAEQTAKEERDKLMAQVAEESGLFFFFDESCSICNQQAYVLKFLQNTTGLTVFPVSLDGSQIPEHLGPAAVNAGQAEAMGILQTPAMVLSHPETGQIRVISQGSPLAANELIKRILLSAKVLAILSPEEYERGSAVKGYGSLINVENSEEIFTEDVMNDPAKLVETLRALGGSK